MATYSTNLALTLINTGDQAGTWGVTTNTNLGTLLEQAISGYVTQAITDGADTTITIPNGATGVARNMYIECTGTLSADRNLVVPANKKLYFIYNNTSGGFAVTVKVSGQTGVSVPNGEKRILVSNGTDIVEAVSAGLEGITSSTSLALTALGYEAGDSATGEKNTTIGYQSGTAITTGSLNTLVGYRSGATLSTATSNTAVGFEALSENSVTNCTFVGAYSGRNVNGTSNTALGYQACQGGAGMSGTYNSAVGWQSLRVITTGNWNTTFGTSSGAAVTTGSGNTFIGYGAGAGTSTGASNSALGDTAFQTGNYTNSTCLGANSAVTGSDQVQLGDSSTTTYAYGAVQNRSDIRDKTDIQDTQLGLNFIMALRPRDFRWDMREDYRPPSPSSNASQEEWDAWHEAAKLSNLSQDGTHKRVRFHHGLIAQEVKSTMDSLGIDFGGYQDHKINGGDDALSIGYGELIGPLIKAIQELKAEFDAYKASHP